MIDKFQQMYTSETRHTGGLLSRDLPQNLSVVWRDLSRYVDSYIENTAVRSTEDIHLGT